MTGDQKKALSLIIGFLAMGIAMVVVPRLVWVKGGSQRSTGARIVYDTELVPRPVAQNSEEWEIIRNDKGRLEKIVVKRIVSDLQ